jgi:hypothetical protein
MIIKIVLEELEIIQGLLNQCLSKMYEIISPKKRNIFWSLFFPAGKFMQQQSIAKDASLLLLDVNTRLREIIEVLQEKNHNLLTKLNNLLDLDLILSAEKLIELPERAQYQIPQIEGLNNKVKILIQEIMNNKEKSA